MQRIGRTMVRKPKRLGLTLALRCGYEMLISSRQKGWKSGVTVERASAMPVAALRGCHSLSGVYGCGLFTG